MLTQCTIHSNIVLAYSNQRFYSDSEQKRTSGFTIVEAFVGILITMISLTIALQMFMITTYMRARIQQFSEGHKWIQEDFETVRTKATTFEQEAVPHSSYCDAQPIENLAAKFITTDTIGLGGTSTSLGTKDFNGKEYKLTRKAKTSSIAPKRLVALQYELFSTDNESTSLELELDAEVVIYAAFKCPIN